LWRELKLPPLLGKGHSSHAENCLGVFAYAETFSAEFSLRPRSLSYDQFERQHRGVPSDIEWQETTRPSLWMKKSPKSLPD
jgi:hypothetical protein